MKIREIKSRTIITKSKLPGADYVLNPYIGCRHSCIYCYADFIKRFTGHGNEEWGTFVDVKIFDIGKIKPYKYNSKRILVGSVTDPYQPVEAKYMVTRKILDRLKTTAGRVEVLTKSALVSRDIDIFKEFADIRVGISLVTLDNEIAKILEPFASLPGKRTETLKLLHKNHIHTFLFISPVLPRITDFKNIIRATKSFVDTYMFENINIRPGNVAAITGFLKKTRPELLSLYERIRKQSSFWWDVEKEIKIFCKSQRIKYEIYFHHGGFKK
ncbi:radical SAM protein [Acidobacteriota bacterium]